MDKNRILLLALCLSVLTFWGGCLAPLPEIRSQWPDDPIRFSDSRSMWISQTVIHSFGRGIQAALSNDERNAYLFFSPGKSNAEPFNRMARLTVWFYRSGGKNWEHGIRFVPVPPASKEGGRFHPEGASGSDPLRQDAPGPRRQVTVMDRRADREIDVPNDGTRGVLFRAYVDQDPAVYELCLSLSRGDERSFGLDARPGETIGIEVEWKPVDFKDMRKSSGKTKEERQANDQTPGEGGAPGPGMAIPPMKRTIRFNAVLAESRSPDSSARAAERRL